MYSSECISVNKTADSYGIPEDGELRRLVVGLLGGGGLHDDDARLLPGGHCCCACDNRSYRVSRTMHEACPAVRDNYTRTSTTDEVQHWTSVKTVVCGECAA